MTARVSECCRPRTAITSDSMNASSTKYASAALMVSSAPADFANSSFASVLAAAMTCAPSAFAISTAVMPSELRYCTTGAEARPARASVASWRELHSDQGAEFDKLLVLDAADIKPQVTWGTSPGMVTDVSACVPAPDEVPPTSGTHPHTGEEITRRVHPDEPLGAMTFKTISVTSSRTPGMVVNSC